MKDYRSNYDKAVAYVDAQYEGVELTEKQRENIIKQVLAKRIAKFGTIGKENGKLVVRDRKDHPKDKPKLP